MPEINDSEYRSFVAYQNLGTPQEVSKKITDLENDNRKYRQEEKPALEAKLPKEGEVIVPKEKVEVLEKYEALGKPEELKTVVSERDELREKDAARTRQDAFRAATKALGWPEETVATLLDMRSLDGAAVEVKTEKDGKGEDVQVPYVTLAGDDQKPQKFADFASSTPQLKGLRVEPATKDERTQSSQSRTFPQQTEDGKPKKVTKDDHRSSVRNRIDYSL